MISCAGGEIKRDAVELTNFHDRKKAFILFPHNFPRQENDEEMADGEILWLKIESKFDFWA